MSTQPHEQPDNARNRLRKAKRALYREAIVDAAEQVFAEHGYDAAKVHAIAKTAGVSLATLYATFPKKWDIFRALQKDRLEALMREIGTTILETKTPFGRLRRGIEGYLRFHMEHPDFLRLQLRERIPWGTTDDLRTPEQSQAWEAGLRMMITAFEHGIDKGLFLVDDPELCARTATAMSQVRLSLWVDRGMVETPDKVTEDAIRQMVRTFGKPELVDELLAADP